MKETNRVHSELNRGDLTNVTHFCVLGCSRSYFFSVPTPQINDQISTFNEQAENKLTLLM